MLIFLNFLNLLSIKCEFISKFDEKDPAILIIDKLPTLTNSTILDYKLMPYVGNGHLAWTIFDDILYLNGLYNGRHGVSHRAQIPNIQNFFIVPLSTSDYKIQQYVLDLREGVFYKQIEFEHALIQRRIFAHQYFNRLLVTQLIIKRKNDNFTGPVSYNLMSISLESNDFNFEPVVNLSDYNFVKGKTIDVEFEEFQKNPIDLFMYFTPIDESIGLKENENELIKTYVSSIDVNDDSAKNEMKIANRLIKAGKHEDLFREHVEKFKNIWNFGRIEVDNFELQTTIYSSYYYLLSSLPALEHYGKLNQFYGLSPGSLSRGSNLTDYQGHSFWDTETWMFPSVLMFYPTLAKEILSYRTSNPEALEYNAKLFNTSGWRFPWESAYTSLDVTPDCCPHVKLYQLHINGDIAFAARQYYIATRDNDWLLNEKGGMLIAKLAEFWSSRISYNKTKNQNEILGVLPPDEDAQPNVNNSVYTNIIASLSIYFAEYASCISGNKLPFNKKSINQARCLHIPYDNEKKIHLEFEGFKDKPIKQADVVLIQFPLMWDVDPETKKNNLLYYENLTRINGPAMTWGMHAIGHIDIGEFEKADELLKRSYSRYVKKPFNIWTEAYMEVGAVNFITGAGGFLQTFLFGYGGLRLDVNHLKIDGQIPLPPNSSYLYFHNIKYLGSVFSFNYTKDSIELNFDLDGKNFDNEFELVTIEKASQKSSTKDLAFGVTKLKKGRLEYRLQSKVRPNCPLPYDKIDLKQCTAA